MQLGHICKKHTVKANEFGGADHEIIINNWDLPIISECKRIAFDTSPSRIRTIISKANKQIKRHPTIGYGIVVINMTEKVPVRNEITDRFPPELELFKDEVINSLKFHYSSVSAALLFWNEIQIMWPYENSNLIMVVLRTRSEIILHQNPKIKIPSTVELKEIKIGNMISYYIRLRSKLIFEKDNTDSTIPLKYY